MKCTKCDHINPENEAYCLSCGEQLGEDTDIQNSESVEENIAVTKEVAAYQSEAATAEDNENRTDKIKRNQVAKIIAGISAVLLIGIFAMVYNNQRTLAKQSEVPQAETVEETREPIDRSEVIVTIGDEAITHPIFNLYFWITQTQFESAGPNIWEMDSNGRKTIDIAKDSTLNDLKVVIAAKRKAEELNLALSDEEQQEIYNQASQVMTQNPDIVSLLQFEVEDMQEFITHSFWVQKVLEHISEEYTPTEKEIDEQFELMKPSYETATAKHVLIRTNDEQGQPLPEEKVKEARRLAEEVLQKALAGEDMAQLAKTYSEDPGSKDAGGEYTFPRGQMVPEFEEAAFTGEIGEVYPEIVETTFGYHIIKVEARDFGDANTIRETAERAIRNQYARDELTKLSEALEVKKTNLFEEKGLIKQ